MCGVICMFLLVCVILVVMGLLLDVVMFFFKFVVFFLVWVKFMKFLIVFSKCVRKIGYVGMLIMCYCLLDVVLFVVNYQCVSESWGFYVNVGFYFLELFVYFFVFDDFEMVFWYCFSIFMLYVDWWIEEMLGLCWIFIQQDFDDLLEVGNCDVLKVLLFDVLVDVVGFVVVYGNCELVW